MNIEIKKKTPKRLIINITEVDHKKIREFALKADISITKWINQAIMAKFAKERVND